MKAFVLSLLSLAAALPAASAQAQTKIHTQVTLASDYRYQGVSSSDRQPVAQGLVHVFRPDGWEAGLFASQVRYGYAGAPTYELDLYGGRTLRVNGATDLKVQGLYTTFPDNRTPGPGFDFVQASLSVVRREGPLTLTALGAYIPRGSFGAGEIWRAEASPITGSSRF